jgi:murein DD-endopeptidase MepM/ murein hydrolase activator NlpD
VINYYSTTSPSPGPNQGYDDPWDFSLHPTRPLPVESYGTPDPQFMTYVQMVLMRNGVDISKISPEQLAELYYKAWRDPYVGQLWNAFSPSAAGAASGTAPIDFSVSQSQFITALGDQMFSPSSSSDTSLLSMSLGLLQQQQKPLTSGAGGQQAFLAAQTTNVPMPFDRRYAGNVTLDFGTHWNGEVEDGIDYGLPVGTPLRSPFAGTIMTEDDGKRNWGKRVFVKLDNGYTFAIGHMTQFNVTNGQRVNPGDLLGLSGGAVGDPSSGNSTGPHVEVQWIAPNGSFQNPHSIMDQIWTGTSFAALGEPGAMGAGVTPMTADELAGIDPVLKAQYPGAYSLWQKYFGSVPNSQQVMALVGYGGGSGSYGQGGGGMASDLVGGGGNYPATPLNAAPRPGGLQGGIQSGLSTALAALQGAVSGGGGGSGSASGSIDLASLARQAGFPESAIPTAVAIAMAESGGNPNAIGDKSIGGSDGLWQIYTKAHPDLVQKYNLFDPLQNAMAAYQVYKNAGNKFTPWTTYNTGAYLKYVGQNATVNMSGSSGGTGSLSPTGPLLDNNQIEDRIRAMPSRLAGMNMGQYFDLRSLADTTSQSTLGHVSTDSIVKDLWDAKATDPQSVKDWYGYHTPNEIDYESYKNIVIANQDWLASIYNEPGFDPRYASSQYTPPAPKAPSAPTTPGLPDQNYPGPPPPTLLERGIKSGVDQAVGSLTKLVRG